MQRLLSGQALPDRQFLSYVVLVALLDQTIPTYITEQVLHILLQPRISHVALVLLPHLRLLKRARYLRRWGRRLTEEGLSPEDAVIVSHASFGIDEEAETFGAEVILTTDLALKSHYERTFARISQRFERMTGQLKIPYRNALLPSILTPEEMLEALLG